MKVHLVLLFLILHQCAILIFLCFVFLLNLDILAQIQVGAENRVDM
jgi:hypothetical protein